MLIIKLRQAVMDEQGPARRHKWQSRQQQRAQVGTVSGALLCTFTEGGRRAGVEFCELVPVVMARLFGVVGSNPPDSMSSSLSDSSISVFLIHACGIITPCV